jgi:probable rRNA maturation factor
MRHKIYIANDIKDRTLSPNLIRRTVKAALFFENVGVPCEISVLITDDEGIRSINSEFRNQDRPTDVLSFPCFEFSPGSFDVKDGEIDGAGLLPLGDIVLSAERIAAQAAEYGSTLRRETAYLVVHSVLHLLGYDHVSERDKRQMRAREKVIIEKS